MSEDISALFTVSIYVEAMLGLLLLYTWVQKPEIKAVAWWGSADLLRAGSIALFGSFGSLPEVITVDAANAILLMSFAVTWAGIRLFGGRSINFTFVLAGPIIWKIFSMVPVVAESEALCSLLSSGIIAAYLWLAAAELWRLNEGRLVSRLPAFFILFAQGALFLMRTPLGVLMPHPDGSATVFGSIWLTVLSSQALMLTVAIAFVLMAMAKERGGHMQKTLIDRLGGIPDQHGLMTKIMG
jgi:hypothetical protein